MLTSAYAPPQPATKKFGLKLLIGNGFFRRAFKSSKEPSEMTMNELASEYMIASPSLFVSGYISVHLRASGKRASPKTTSLKFYFSKYLENH